MVYNRKIDGANARIILLGDEHLIGSRKEILTHSDDLIYNSALGIVDGLQKMINIPKSFDKLTIVYGEFYGGKVSKASKQYGNSEDLGFRVFDVSVIDDFSILESDIKSISNHRKHKFGNGLVYGNPFLSPVDLTNFCQNTQT